MQISVVMIVRDGMPTIENSLRRLSRFEDVLVYDNGSRDGTQSAVRAFQNVRLVEGYFDGFGSTKNRAATYAKNDWIFVLDADEMINLDLVTSLASLRLEDDTVYLVRRQSWYRGKRVLYSGWGDESVRRIYNRNSTSFSESLVHEDLELHSLKQKSIESGLIEHHSYRDLSDFITKVDLYSNLYAREHAGKRDSSPLKAITSGLYSFCKTYFIKRGFLDGYVGLVIAFSHMATNFFKYIKLYEANRELLRDRR